MKPFLKTHWPVLLLCLVFVVSSAWLQHGGWLLYGEADWFLIDHNDPDRSFLNTILCPHKHDADQYLAREVAHVAEHIDARFIHFCVMNGIPHFLSITNYLSLCLSAFLFWKTARNVIHESIILLLIAVFFTAPCILMSGTYVRSGHALSSMLMVCLVLFLWKEFKADPFHPPNLNRALSITFYLSLAMIWADRQGLFAAVCIISAIMIFGTHGYRLSFSMMISAAIVLHTVYYLFIGPVLVNTFTGFVVGKNYQMDVVSGLVPTLIKNYGAGFMVATNNFMSMFGSLSTGMAIGFMACLSFILGKRRWWIVPSVYLLMATMYSLILFHQSVLVWPDMIANNYYNIFATVFLFLLAGYCISKVSASNHTAMALVLSSMLVGNILEVPAEVARLKSGHLTGFIAGAPFMRQALKQTVMIPDGKSLVRYNTKESSTFTDWKWVMKNPLEYGGKLTPEEFVESSQYLQFVRSQKKLPFNRGGR